MYETNFYRSLLPQILEVYVYFSSSPPIGLTTWRLTKIDTYYKSVKKNLSTGTIGYPSRKSKSSRRQVGCIFVHFYFGECSVLRPLTVFAFLFNPTVR